MTMTPVDKAFNAIARKTTLPPHELYFILRQLVSAAAAEEFATVLSVNAAGEQWGLARDAAYRRAVRLQKKGLARLLTNRNFIISSRAMANGTEEEDDGSCPLTGC